MAAWPWSVERVCEGARIRLRTRRIAVAAQVEKAAEDPRPAPMGSVERAIKVKEGLEGNVSGVFEYVTGLGTSYAAHLSFRDAVVI
jgi:hypothetical protein